jgi:hypothetical protein
VVSQSLPRTSSREHRLESRSQGRDAALADLAGVSRAFRPGTGTFVGVSRKTLGRMAFRPATLCVIVTPQGGSPLAFPRRIGLSAPSNPPSASISTTSNSAFSVFRRPSLPRSMVGRRVFARWQAPSRIPLSHPAATRRSHSRPVPFWLRFPPPISAPLRFIFYRPSRPFSPRDP